MYVSHATIISFGMAISFVYVSSKIVESHEKEVVETINTSKEDVKAAKEDFVRNQSTQS